MEKVKIGYPITEDRKDDLRRLAKRAKNRIGVDAYFAIIKILNQNIVYDDDLKGFMDSLFDCNGDTHETGQIFRDVMGTVFKIGRVFKKR